MANIEYGEDATLHDLPLLVGDGDCDGAWRATASLLALSLAELGRLSFAAQRGESFQLWARSSASGEFDLNLDGVGDAPAFGGSAGGRARLIQRGVAADVVLAELTLKQTVAAVPEVSSWISWLLGGSLLGWRRLVARRLGSPRGAQL